MYNRLIILLTALLWIVTQGANAVEPSEFFPSAKLMYSQDLESVDYRVALSVPKKVNNEWAYAKEKRVKGSLNKRTLELDNGNSYADALAKLNLFFDDQGARRIFQCEGLDCGSSNVWANEHFNVRQLYGLDQSQAYNVVQLSDGSQTQYLMTYLSQRGNRRLYLQWELLSPSDRHAKADAEVIAADATVIVSSLQQAGYFVLSSFSPETASEEELLSIATALKVLVAKKFVIVGHSYGEHSLDERISASERLAESVYKRLLDKGVAETRLAYRGLGSLAPRDRSGLVRVEVVVQ